jgi:hypothetical protein
MFSKAYGREATKHPVFWSGINSSKRAHMLKSQMKITIITFNIKGTVHYEFISQGQTVNQVHYVEILKRLNEAVHITSPELWLNNRILLHDDAPAHKELSVKQFLAQKFVTGMEHLSHSPYFAPSCFQK